MGRTLKVALMLAATALMPTLAYAQASITGVVKDTSGAILPSYLRGHSALSRASTRRSGARNWYVSFAKTKTGPMVLQPDAP